VRRSFIKIAIICCAVFVVTLFLFPMQDYGLKGRFKNMVLHLLLDDDVPKIGVTTAAGKLNNAVFLDSRSPGEFNVSHIPGALYVGYKHFNLAKVAHLNKEQEIVVYCAIGKRSNNVNRQLQKAGFKNSYNLYGGIFEWVNQGHAVVDNKGKSTQAIHAYSKLFGWWLKRGQKVY
jgi:rhodanese-related sulfurtransferase